ncbi:LamG-like jellyroll fold domain-containing protein [Paenibacillus sp. NPDC058174]|uniref:LamG-like jellyroll fold domain-containing protein n=1 Tax=Paenibacillus sp. NPDC058174 TaxID=3346366 RepID=UPI0036DC47DD
MKHGRTYNAAALNHVVTPLAHWRFSQQGVLSGSVKDENLVIRDESGNGNSIMLAVANTTSTEPAATLNCMSWEHSGSNTFLQLNNDRNARGNGYYFRTEQNAPLNKETFVKGFTIEAIISLPDPFDHKIHSWMGVVTRQGQGAELDRTGEAEVLATMSVSNCKEIQWVSHPMNMSTSTTSWSRYLEEGKWHHIAIVNDTQRTLLYVNGICDYNSPVEPISGIAAIEGNGWNIGASEWGGRIDNLFSGALKEIRISGLPLHQEDWLSFAAEEELLEGRYTGEPQLTGESNYHFIFVPDPQMQSYLNPEMLEAQTEWIAKQQHDLQIEMTAFVGDFVHNSDSTVEWNRASSAVLKLDESDAAYMATAGNHDYDHTHAYLRFFGPQRFASKAYYKGFSPSRYSSYAIKNAGSYNYLWLMVDMQNVRVDLAWCKEILSKYAQYPTILVSHDLIYMLSHGDTNIPYESENGAFIWEQLINPYQQVFMTVNGHFNGNVHQICSNENGQDVIQMLVNYQDRYRGGNGWLRLVELDEQNNAIKCRSFSPWVAKLSEDAVLQYPDYLFLTGDYDEFELNFDFAARFAFVEQNKMGTSS